MTTTKRKRRSKRPTRKAPPAVVTTTDDGKLKRSWPCACGGKVSLPKGWKLTDEAVRRVRDAHADACPSRMARR